MTENRKPEKAKDFSEKFLQISGKVFEVLGKIIKWWFWLAMFGFGLIFWLLDLWLGDGSNPVPSPWDKKRPEFDPNQFRQEFPNIKVKDVKEFQEKLEQLERQDRLDSKQKDVVRKLRQFDGSKYDSRLRDVFEDDELEELILLILILLGVEIS
ncbi:MAG: hypothetical protein JGK21_09320 [Microcoleus sp. PH2017_22_RUC_O_B]|uniref:hypothetical protein n=1 Tax=unclassified Microcoleus TaxID=2642155 RepID=UPI001D8EB179|nr:MULTISPECIES: hypothetical protein [unclassified Microcoleus]MCC3528397.1 hypothetical protein [Microcoleus sp. PH2017_21_RUC_O_A]MCC3540573.1 hypothetical protein [Microcoleus sp. PH2017_22_RUC_O_B]